MSGDAQPFAIGESLQRGPALFGVGSPSDGGVRSFDEFLARAQAHLRGIAERVDHVGVPAQELAEHAARAEQPAQALCDLRRLAERGGQLHRALRTRREVAQAQQAEIRIGRRRQPIQQERQQLLHEPRRAREPAGQLAHGLARAFHVGEAEGRQASRGRLLGEDAIAVVGERFEQRPEPQTLVDRSHGALMAAQIAQESFGRARRDRAGVAEHACEPVLLQLVLGNGVDLLLVVELQPVFDRTQVPVGRRASWSASWRPTYPASASSARAVSVVGVRSSSSAPPCTS